MPTAYMRAGTHGDNTIFLRVNKRLPTCACGYMEEYLCDFETSPGQTCSASLCSVCAFAGAIDRKDIEGREEDLLCYCPKHFNQYLNDPTLPKMTEEHTEHKNVMEEKPTDQEWYLRFEGMGWCNPYSTTIQDLEWLLRYGTPEEILGKRLVLAGIVQNFVALCGKDDPSEIVEKMKAAHKAATKKDR